MELIEIVLFTPGDFYGKNPDRLESAIVEKDSEIHSQLKDFAEINEIDIREVAYKKGRLYIRIMDKFLNKISGILNLRNEREMEIFRSLKNDHNSKVLDLNDSQIEKQ